MEQQRFEQLLAIKIGEIKAIFSQAGLDNYVITLIARVPEEPDRYMIISDEAKHARDSHLKPPF